MLIDRLLLLSCFCICFFFQTSMAQDFPALPSAKEKPLSIYPNPANDVLNIDIKKAGLEGITVEVFNIIGNPVNVSMETIGNNSFRIDVKDLAPGYYMVMVKDEQARFKQALKFLKQ